jgi:hypothetical protein
VVVRQVRTVICWNTGMVIRRVIRGRRDRGGQLVARPDDDGDRNVEPLPQRLFERVLQRRPAVGGEQDVAALLVGAHVGVPGGAEALGEDRHADHVLAADVDPT